MLIKIKDYKVHRLNQDIFQIYIKSVKYCHAYVYVYIMLYIYNPVLLIIKADV